MKGADTPMPNSQWHAMSRSVIRDTVNSIKRNSLMSLASVLSIMAALVVLGFFLILTINIRQATANVESGLE
ncbi:MAG: permease-like cell division protein FtsX, partial [Eubacterium aggregans]